MSSLSKERVAITAINYMILLYIFRSHIRMMQYQKKLIVEFLFGPNFQTLQRLHVDDLFSSHGNTWLITLLQQTKFQGLSHLIKKQFTRGWNFLEIRTNFCVAGASILRARPAFLKQEPAYHRLESGFQRHLARTRTSFPEVRISF